MLLDELKMVIYIDPFGHKPNVLGKLQQVFKSGEALSSKHTGGKSLQSRLHLQLWDDQKPISLQL